MKSSRLIYTDTSQSGLISPKISRSDLIKILESKEAFVTEVREILVGLGSLHSLSFIL